MLLSLTKPRPGQRGPRVGPAAAPSKAVTGPTFSRYVAVPLRSDAAPFRVPGGWRGSGSNRGATATDGVLYDGGVVDNRQDPQSPRFSRYPMTDGLVTRQVGHSFGRYKAAAANPPMRWSGFLAAMRVGVGRAAPAPSPYRSNPTTGQASPGVVVFPVQYAGLRLYYAAAVHDLCLVAEADAPSGMGGVAKVYKGGVQYAMYLVETGDANASPARVNTTTGIKSVRVKT